MRVQAERASGSEERAHWRYRDASSAAPGLRFPPSDSAAWACPSSTAAPTTSRVDRDDPSRARPRRQLSRHRRHLRPVHERAARRPRDPRPARRGRARDEVRQRARTPTARFLGINGRPEYVRQACDASLQRLGVDTIDLYYQHRVDPDDADRGHRRRDGRAGAPPARCGTSACRRPRRRRSAARAAVHPIAALQTEYSLWTPRSGGRSCSRRAASSASASWPTARSDAAS